MAGYRPGRGSRAAAAPAVRHAGLGFKGQTIIPNGPGVPLAGQDLTRVVQKAGDAGSAGKGVRGPARM
jgi:hypothetical protein